LPELNSTYLPKASIWSGATASAPCGHAGHGKGGRPIEGAAACRFNKQCRQLYLRLKEKGKPYKLIAIAVANKLLRQAFAVIKNKRVYDPYYISSR
jgi:hypothetical protein